MIKVEGVHLRGYRTCLVLQREVCGVDDDVSVLGCDVTRYQLELDSSHHDCDITECGRGRGG